MTEDNIDDPVTLELKQDKLRIEIERGKQEIRKVSAEAERHEYEARRTKKEMHAWDASADEHRIYNFFGGVDSSNCASCMDVLGNWERQIEFGYSDKFTIVFNSPGGNVIAGLALFDFLDDLKRDKKIELTTVARGMAASMGGVLLQAGSPGRRFVGSNAHVLIHEVSSLGMGKVSELEDELKFTKRLQERLLDILAERSTMSKAQIKVKWGRRDWWLNSDECVEFGFADHVG